VKAAAELPGPPPGSIMPPGSFSQQQREVVMRAILLFAALYAAGGMSAFAQDKATIEKLNDRFAQAFNKGDAAAVAAMYTPDAVVLPPGSEMVKGRSAIQAFWKKSAEQIGDIKLTTLDVKPPQDVAGKYVVVRHKAGRAWKLGADIWNADK
jgi:ketosteroid isomerase-like protein